MKLSKRLTEISKMVDKNKSVLDIGCDHGLLDIYLIKENNNGDVLAVDLRQSALNQAIENIKKYKVEDKVKVLLSDGYSNINRKYDITIMSGLGTTKILDIINNSNNYLSDVLIIQSNNNIEILRKRITSMNYLILDEKIVKENDIFSIIIKFKKGNYRYSKKDLFFGPILRKNKDKTFIEYNNYLINGYKKILLQLTNKNLFLKIKTNYYIRKIKKETK